MAILRNLAALMLTLPLLGCGGVANRALPLDPTLIMAQPLARTAERPPPFARRIAQSNTAVGGGIAGMLIGAAVTATINNDERQRSRIGEVPSPAGVDPAAIIEAMIGDHLITNFAARPNLREFYSGSVRATASFERAEQVAALARRRGLSGLVIDVVALEFYADSTGRNLGLVDEAFSVVVTAQLTLIDVATGTIVASGACEGKNGNTQPIQNAVEDGARLTTLLAQKAAANCAVQLIGNVLQ